MNSSTDNPDSDGLAALPPDSDKVRQNTVFGVVDEQGQLIFETLKSNPKKALRFYERLLRPVEKYALVRFLMKRTRKPGDVSGLTEEQMRNKGPYIGPMR